MNCNYCNKPAVWVENKEVYGRNYGKSYMIWLCKPCDAYVGCHLNTEKPLGTMANKKLRALRIKAKDLFISFKLNGKWNGDPQKKNVAYRWLRDNLKITADECHFGLFNEVMCKKVIELFNTNNHD